MIKKIIYLINLWLLSIYIIVLIFSFNYIICGYTLKYWFNYLLKSGIIVGIMIMIIIIYLLKWYKK